MSDPIDLEEAFATFDERWAPRVITRVNDYDVRIARVEGDHAWHVHHDTDEFFLCLAGALTIEMRERTVVLRPGQAYTVPCGVEHFPRAEPDTRILLFEPAGTPTTGDEHGDIGHLRTTTGIELEA